METLDTMAMNHDPQVELQDRAGALLHTQQQP
jgi:hypothetical protein